MAYRSTCTLDQSRTRLKAGEFLTQLIYDRDAIDKEAFDMSKWLWAVALALQAHCGASYVAPTQPHLGLFNYIWPWAAGDHGLFGTHPNLLSRTPWLARAHLRSQFDLDLSYPWRSTHRAVR